jgi:MoaA/NifB/PqqE/SkfB family radical SAM enzyme
MSDDEVIKRLIIWSNRGNAPPEMVQIYPTNKCNLRCIFCYQQLQKYDIDDIVPKERWLEIIEEICKLGVKKILISGGGEPLAEPDLTLKIMQKAKNFKIEGRMITNGTLWTDDSIKKTVRMGWDALMFSIDAPDEKTHDYLRGIKSSFKKSIDNIKKFQYWKERYNSYKPKIEFTTVLNIFNYRKVPGMVKLAKTLGVTSVSVEPVCVNNPDVEKMKLQKKEREEFFKVILPKMQEMAQKFGISTNCNILKEVKEFEKTGNLKDMISQSVKKGKSKNPFLNLPCYEPWIWPKIEANGDVWPCSTTPLKVNIRDKDFKDIWFGSEFENFRKNIMNGKLSESCSNCVATHLAINKKIRKKLRSVLQ